MLPAGASAHDASQDAALRWIAAGANRIAETGIGALVLRAGDAAFPLDGGAKIYDNRTQGCAVTKRLGSAYWFKEIAELVDNLCRRTGLYVIDDSYT